jgi:hypothetical protein
LALSEFVDRVESYHSAFADLASASRTATSLLNSDVAKELSTTVEGIRHWRLEERSVAELRTLLDLAVESAKLLQEAEDSFHKLMDFVGCDVPLTIANASSLLAMLSTIDALQIRILTFRLPCFEKEQTKIILETARHESESLKATEALLSRDFDLTLHNGAVTSQQLKTHASTIEQTGIFQRFFGSPYRHAARDYRIIALRNGKTSRAIMSQALTAVAQYDQKQRQFTDNILYRRTFSNLFRGVKTPWEDLQQTCTWYQEVLAALPEENVRACAGHHL